MLLAADGLQNYQQVLFLLSALLVLFSSVLCTDFTFPRIRVQRIEVAPGHPQRVRLAVGYGTDRAMADDPS